MTEGGLEDQLLALIVSKERPDLEEAKSQLIIQNSEFTIKLKAREGDRRAGGKSFWEGTRLV